MSQPFSRGRAVTLFGAIVIGALAGACQPLVFDPSSARVDSPNPRAPALLRFTQGIIYDIVLSPDGSRIALGSETGVYLFDADTFQPLSSVLLPASALAFHPQLPILVIGYDGTFHTWDFDSGAVNLFAGEPYPAGTFIPSALAFSPNGQFLALKTYTWGCDGVGSAFQLWDFDNTRLLLQRRNCLHWETPVFAFSADSQSLILGFREPEQLDPYVDLIDTHSAAVVAHYSGTEIIAAGNDGRTVVLRSTQPDNRLQGFDLQADRAFDLGLPAGSTLLAYWPYQAAVLFADPQGHAVFLTGKTDPRSCDMGEFDASIASDVGSSAALDKVVILHNRFGDSPAALFQITDCALLLLVTHRE